MLVKKMTDDVIPAPYPNRNSRQANGRRWLPRGVQENGHIEPRSVADSSGKPENGNAITRFEHVIDS